MSKQSKRGQRALSACAAAVALIACGEIPTDTKNFAPKGAMEGTVVYTGPLPCVQGSHILGAAVLLVFNEDLLPAPEGLGTTASQFGVVPGDILFASIAGQLPKSPDDDPNKVVCPPDDGTTVTVSAPWSVGPLNAGRYQVRGFYDRDGDFSPILKLHQLPTAGDIGGGAIANVTEVLEGKPVRYQTFEVGVPDASGKLAIPDNGATIRGVAATLGQQLNFSRPIFHVAAVKDERPSTFKDSKGNEVTGPALAANTDPNKVVLPQDERFLVNPTSYPTQAPKMFLRLQLGAGLPGAYPQAAGEALSERSLGAQSPYRLQTVPPFDYFWLYASADASGAIRTIAETPDVPSSPVKIANLFPQTILAKLDAADASDLVAQAKPAVILQGLVINQSLVGTTVGAFRDPATGKVKPPKPVQELEVGLRPSVICIPEPENPAATVYVVTPRFNAINGDVVVDPVSVAEQVRLQLGNRPNIQVVEGCLPKGRYQMNLVYDSGQAWTVPNEGGVCSGAESKGGAGECTQGIFSRKTLPSQAVTVEIGAPSQADFCEASFAGATHHRGVPVACLTAAERLQ